VDRPGGEELAAGDSPTIAILRRLDVPDFRAGTIARRLGGGPGEGHLLRFQATSQEGPLGGYSVVVQA
jgi:hypothetical protein